MGLESILGEDQPVEVTLWPDGVANPSDSRDIVFSTVVRECAGNKFRVDLPPKADKYFWELAVPGVIAGVVVPSKTEKPLVIYPVVDTLWRDEDYEQGLWFRLESDRQTREQRRQHVRVEIAIPVDIEFGPVTSSRKVPAMTLDISGGGVKFVSAEKFTANREIIIIAQLEPDEGPLRLRAEVVYSRENAPVKTPGSLEPKRTYTTASRFTSLAQREENAIMRECFKHELGLGEK